MQIESIKDKLDQLKYHTFLPKPYTDLIVGEVISTDPEIGGKIVDGFCSVAIVESKIVVEYGYSNIPEEIVFATESEVVSFIKKQFPL